MATIDALCERGELVKIDGLLEEHELEWRLIYGTPEFICWLDEGISALKIDSMADDLTPMEQVVALLAEYVEGESFLDDRRFKKLNGTPDWFVWELKTVHVRIFGWVPKKNIFICCFGDSKDKIVTLNLAQRYIAQTKYVMNCLDLDEPKALQTKEKKMSFQLKINRKDLKSARFISKLATSLQKQLILSGMTQQQVAQKIGVDRAVVNRRLRGDANLTARSIAEFAYAFDKDIELNFLDRAKPRANTFVDTASTQEVTKVQGSTKHTISRGSTKKVILASL